MTELQQVLEGYLDEELIRIVLSGPKKKEGASKVRIRPVMIKKDLLFQAARTVGTKEFHENYKRDQLAAQMESWMAEDFRQLQLESEKGMVSVLSSKKGKLTIKEKRRQPLPAVEDSGCGDLGLRRQQLAHNRKKRYILEEGSPVGYLEDLGVMTREGKVIRAKYDKFRQINRFLEYMEDILPVLPKDRELTLVDFGCGKFYLTFAMYDYLHVKKGYDVRIIGLDLKEDMIAHCAALAEKYHYEKLSFCQGDIASYEGVDRVDMVVTLHACDTATDFALAKAVSWGASVILSVPCCQHELNGQIANPVLAPVFHYGVLKERMAALMTDGLRAQMLEQVGYETQILEFIDMEHTPKNLLIRAVYTGRKKDNREQLRVCLKEFGLHPALERLLFEEAAHL